MSAFIIEIGQDVIEAAATKILIPDGVKGGQYLSELAKDWMNPGREPAWFDQDDICHFNGCLLDAKTKVKVLQNGKKIDSFKGEDVIQQVTITNAYKLETAPPSAGAIAGLALSEGVHRFQIETDNYDRSLLAFQAKKLQLNINFNYVECFALTGVIGWQEVGVDAVGKSEQAYYSFDPSSSLPKPEYNKKFATAFRKMIGI